MIGFNYSFNPLYQRAPPAWRAGTLGDLVSARSMFAAAARPLLAWKESRRMGGGVLLDLASHYLDLRPFLFASPIEEVWARRLSSE